tara:strand:- start:407 stop:640 length:234 start_codon:yes stop_codon:yes gene_type:complete
MANAPFKMKYQGNNSAFPFKSPIKYEKDPKELLKRLSGPKMDPDAPGHDDPNVPGYEPKVEHTWPKKVKRRTTLKEK